LIVLLPEHTEYILPQTYVMVKEYIKTRTRMDTRSSLLVTLK